LPRRRIHSPKQSRKKTGGPPGQLSLALMTYEEHLDEVTTLITEKYDVEDDKAINMVMRAQADDYFSGHDDDTSICTLERAHLDAKTVFKKYK
jgi:hypothetical protein